MALGLLLYSLELVLRGWCEGYVFLLSSRALSCWHRQNLKHRADRQLKNQLSPSAVYPICPLTAGQGTEKALTVELPHWPKETALIVPTFLEHLFLE